MGNASYILWRCQLMLIAKYITSSTSSYCFDCSISCLQKKGTKTAAKSRHSHLNQNDSNSTARPCNETEIEPNKCWISKLSLCVWFFENCVCFFTKNKDIPSLFASIAACNCLSAYLRWIFNECDDGFCSNALLGLLKLFSKWFLLLRGDWGQ